MARYFFSVRSGGRLLPDREGVDLPDGADLEACAVYLARKLRLDLDLPSSDLDSLTVEVTDPDGTLLKTIALDGA